MVIKVQVKGAKRVRNLAANLGPILNKEIMKKSKEFMVFVQKSAKLRAPRMTGRLAESIKLSQKNKNEIKIIVGSPYGTFQEYGFTPHIISSGMSDRMGGTVGGLFNKQDSFFFVSKHTPFMTPALEAGISRLPNMLNNATKKAIKVAEGRK